jgi:hypothetical protein
MKDFGWQFLNIGSITERAIVLRETRNCFIRLPDLRKHSGKSEMGTLSTRRLLRMVAFWSVVKCRRGALMESSSFKV